jgi:hypothetical protein
MPRLLDAARDHAVHLFVALAASLYFLSFFAAILVALDKLSY